MCGILGVFNYSSGKSVDREALKRATDIISHRGPDGEGFYYDDMNGVGFGHRRLSIIDLETGDQPMSNVDETVWIIYNGEIYNFKELREILIKKGYKFRTKSDTEVILNAYIEYGKDCPNHLNGIFAFAIWDKNKRELFLARDHFGVKPLYYYYDHEKFVCASEIKAILEYAKPTREINQGALSQCITFRLTLPSDTLIKNIYKLGAANSLIIDKQGNISIRRYYNKIISIDHSKSFDYWKSELEDKYEKAIRRQLVADVPIGLSLSGGVDSATILSIMSKYSNGRVKTYTVGFEGGKDEDNEIDKAKYLSNLFGAEFNSYVITEKDYLDFLEKYVWHLEEPVGNESAVAYYYVANLAYGNVKVLLNGQGADEPFAGYDRYLGIYYAEKYKALLNPLSKILAKIFPFVDRRQQFKRLEDYFTFTLDVDKIKSASAVVDKFIGENILNEELKQIASQAFNIYYGKIVDKNFEGNVLEKLIYYDMFSSLSENLLLAEDKMAMANSIEARVPFLDVELIEIALSIPDYYKIGRISGKKIHKKVCEKFIPKRIVYQKKIGFNNPMKDWLNNSLGKQLNDLVNSNSSITKNYLNKEIIDRMIKEHQMGVKNYEKFLFLLLSIEKWNKIFLNR